MTTINAISYLRVSTDEQVRNGNGLKIQKNEIRDYCIQNNINLLAEFSDEGISGANDITKRKGLNNLLQFIKTHDVERLLITKMDRIARDVYIQLWIEKELKVFNVEIISINEDSLNGSDYITKAMRQMVGVFAELEKNRIAERLVSGRKIKAENGNKSNGNCPLGYKYAYDQNGNNIGVIIDKEAALIIKKIFNLALDGHSLQAIADKINDLGFKTLRGNSFNKQAIHVILKNKFYIGIIKHGDIEKLGNHLPLINKSKFLKVHNLLTERRNQA